MDAKSIHSYDILWPIFAFLHTLGEGRGEAMLVLLPYDRAAAVHVVELLVKIEMAMLVFFAAAAPAGHVAIQLMHG